MSGCMQQSYLPVCTGEWLGMEFLLAVFLKLRGDCETPNVSRHNVSVTSIREQGLQQ